MSSGLCVKAGGQHHADLLRRPRPTRQLFPNEQTHSHRHERSKGEDGLRTNYWYLLRHDGGEDLAVLGREIKGSGGHYNYNSVRPVPIARAGSACPSMHAPSADGRPGPAQLQVETCVNKPGMHLASGASQPVRYSEGAQSATFLIRRGQSTVRYSEGGQSATFLKSET
jgi:hypothetical protein